MQHIGTGEGEEGQVNEVGVERHGQQQHRQLQQGVQTQENRAGHHGDHPAQNKDLRRAAGAEVFILVGRCDKGHHWRSHLRIGADGELVRSYACCGLSCRFSIILQNTPYLRWSKQPSVSRIGELYNSDLLEPGSEPHHVSRGQAKVHDDGGDGEEVACAVVFVHPTAEMLQRNRSPLKLLGQGKQQQQHVGQKKD